MVGFQLRLECLNNLFSTFDFLNETGDLSLELVFDFLSLLTLFSKCFLQGDVLLLQRLVFIALALLHMLLKVFVLEYDRALLACKF